MSDGFIWLALSTGLLSILTPCVFPMVPITIAYFGAPEEQRAATVRKALLFSLGIIGTFTALGLALAAIFGAAGLYRFAANPVVNLLLAAIFVLFAANLFGWLELRLPSRVLTAADDLARRPSSKQSIAPLLVGATFTLTSVTCTAPFVGTLLVLASQGTWATPLVGMIVYSSAFAFPFFLLALSPRVLARLPRGGEWMRTLRVLIGILEIAAAVKFISNADLVLGWGLFTREVVLLSWALLAIVGAVYLGRGDDVRSWRTKLTPQSLIPSAIAMVLAAWLVSGLRSQPLPVVEAFLPPTVTTTADRTNAPGDSASPEWILNDYDRALSVAAASDALVFVDFTGYTCTNCRWMEANIFTRPEVSAELGKFVLARLYTDGDGEMYERHQEFQEKTFGTVALPLYAVVDARGKVRGTLSGLTRSPDDFISFLRRARAAQVAAAR